MTKICSKCKIEKEINNFCKKSSLKDGLNSSCNKCKSKAAKTYRDANKEIIKKRKKVYRENNKEYLSDKYKLYRDSNKDKLQEYNKNYYINNVARHRNQNKQYRSENKPRCNSINAKRYAAKLKRTVAWSSLDKITEFYIEAHKLTKETGVLHHVDHIIPLQGKNVSGLHVETNLQVITASENCRKSNKFII